MAEKEWDGVKMNILSDKIWENSEEYIVMDETQKHLNERLGRIESRNNRVETDKAWETSKTRIISICIITYIVAVIFMQFMNTKNIYISALIPVLGFFLSTQSLPIIKGFWLKRYGKERGI